ncbi:hypothetical protein [Frankia canadensis]|uniref:hypothetical protein n=1 Tax=Frankia canadensis TaxID=1836972 RepID=UPI0014036674|nr:hypothetical protein [Frankia canadensis]
MILQVLVLTAGLLGLAPLAIASWPILPGFVTWLRRTTVARRDGGLGGGRG